MTASHMTRECVLHYTMTRSIQSPDSLRIHPQMTRECVLQMYNDYVCVCTSNDERVCASNIQWRLSEYIWSNDSLYYWLVILFVYLKQWLVQACELSARNSIDYTTWLSKIRHDSSQWSFELRDETWLRHDSRRDETWLRHDSRVTRRSDVTLGLICENVCMCVYVCV